MGSCQNAHGDGAPLYPTFPADPTSVCAQTPLFQTFPTFPNFIWKTHLKDRLFQRERRSIAISDFPACPTSVRAQTPLFPNFPTFPNLSGRPFPEDPSQGSNVQVRTPKHRYIRLFRLVRLLCAQTMIFPTFPTFPTCSGRPFPGIRYIPIS